MTSVEPAVTHPRLRRAWNRFGWVCAIAVWSVVGVVLVALVDVLRGDTVWSTMRRAESLPAFFSSECGASLVGLARQVEPGEAWTDGVRPWRLLERNTAVLLSSDGDTCVFRTQYIKRVGELVMDGGPVELTFDKKTGAPIWPRRPASVSDFREVERDTSGRFPEERATLELPADGPLLLDGRLRFGPCEGEVAMIRAGSFGSTGDTTLSCLARSRRR